MPGDKEHEQIVTERPAGDPSRPLHSTLTTDRLVSNCVRAEARGRPIATEAVAKAATTDAKKVAAALKAGKWDTVLGPISYDKKGDITVIDYVFYKWKSDGTYSEM